MNEANKPKPNKTEKRIKKKKSKKDDTAEFYAAVKSKFQRWVKSEGPLKGYYVYWVKRIDKKLFAHCTKSLKSKAEEEDIISFEKTPAEIKWIVKIFNKGISIWGRRETSYDKINRDYKQEYISEIITSDIFKFKKNKVKIYLVRFTGEHMGTAAWMRRSDIIGAEKMLREFEKEEAKKGSKLGDYNLTYNGITCNSKPKIYNSELSNNFIMKNNKNEELIYKENINDCPEKCNILKNVRFYRIYDQHGKHRDFNIRKSKAQMRNDVCCLLESVNSLYAIWPKRSMQILNSGSPKKWDDTKILIEKCISKFSPNYKMEILYTKENTSGTLKENMNKMSFFKNTNFIICYRVKGYVSGHSGVIEKGIIRKMRVFEYKKGKKLNAENYKLVKQERLKEDLNMEIEEIAAFLIKKKNFE